MLVSSALLTVMLIQVKVIVAHAQRKRLRKDFCLVVFGVRGHPINQHRRDSMDELSTADSTSERHWVYPIVKATTWSGAFEVGRNMYGPGSEGRRGTTNPK
jgi:hypothetical protein